MRANKEQIIETTTESGYTDLTEVKRPRKKEAEKAKKEESK